MLIIMKNNQIAAIEVINSAPLKIPSMDFHHMSVAYSN